jgi:hypothetical protein
MPKRFFNSLRIVDVRHLVVPHFLAFAPQVYVGEVRAGHACVDWFHQRVVVSAKCLVERMIEISAGLCVLQDFNH